MNSLNKFLQHELEFCRKAFEAGNLGAVQDALILCCEHKTRFPEWLRIALVDSMRSYVVGVSSKKRPGRHARWITQYKQDQIDFARAEAVKDCVDHGIRWVDAYYAASLILKDTYAEGNEDAIEKSYKRYKRRTEKEPMRYKILRCIRFQKPLLQPYTPERREAWQEVLSLRRS